MPGTRYIMIGGFLGAGKTTAVAKLAHHLTSAGTRVGLITNDQGSNIVDTAMLRSRGFATEEIPGGCFCCRFNSLVDASEKLRADTAPHIFIAEPVGSCTDLIATVTYPLRRIYGDRFSVAPLSVLVDPIRALRMFGIEEGARFSDKVRYIYLKQIEEADLIVINKVDTLSSQRLRVIEGAIQARFPGKETLSVSARSGLGLSEWFHKILTGSPAGGASMPINYDTYAEGEALLGWLNCTVHLAAPVAWNGNQVLWDFAEGIQRRLHSAGAEVAHLKMTLSPDRGLNAIGVINLVRNDFIPELSLELPASLESGHLIVNARVEMPPQQIYDAVSAQLAALSEANPALQIRIEHEEHFRPGKPQPTYRFDSLTV